MAELGQRMKKGKWGGAFKVLLYFSASKRHCKPVKSILMENSHVLLYTNGRFNSNTNCFINKILL